MAASVMASPVSLKPSFIVEKSSVRGVPSLAWVPSSFKVEASGGKKIKTEKPYGINDGMDLRDGLDASGRKPKEKGVYQFVDKYGVNVDGYRYYRIGNLGSYPSLYSCLRCSSRLLDKCFGTVDFSIVILALVVL